MKGAYVVIPEMGRGTQTIKRVGGGGVVVERLSDFSGLGKVD
jgi:hypothetical protein